MPGRDKPQAPKPLRKLFFDTSLANPEVIAAEIIMTCDIPPSREEDEEEEEERQ